MSSGCWDVNWYWEFCLVKIRQLFFFLLLKFPFCLFNLDVETEPEFPSVDP